MVGENVQRTRPYLVSETTNVSLTVHAALISKCVEWFELPFMLLTCWELVMNCSNRSWKNSISPFTAEGSTRNTPMEKYDFHGGTHPELEEG